MKRCLFPGSFDPITIGHVAIVKRALKIFDEVIIGIGTNSSKSYLFTNTQRQDFIKQSFNGNTKVTVMPYEKLTVDFCKSIEAGFIIRGLRNSTDFEFESAIAQMNAALRPEIETVFISCSPEHSAISSTIVRDIIRNGGNASAFLPFKLES
jgi:pantetheine-phosphate adenylyltransferase